MFKLIFGTTDSLVQMTLWGMLILRTVPCFINFANPFELCLTGGLLTAGFRN